VSLERIQGSVGDMSEAHQFPLFYGEFDRFLSVQLKNWAALYSAPEDGYINLLQQIYSIFVCKGGERPGIKNLFEELDDEIE